MALVLPKVKYDNIKKVIAESDGKLTQTQIGNKCFINRMTVCKVANSKSYEDYLKKYTTGRSLKDTVTKEAMLKKIIENTETETVETVVKKIEKRNLFKRLFGRK